MQTQNFKGDFGYFSNAEAIFYFAINVFDNESFIPAKSILALEKVSDRKKEKS